MDARVRCTNAALFDGLGETACAELYAEFEALEWFAAFLTENGFQIHRTVHKNCQTSDSYYLYSVKGHGIIGAFSTSNAEVSRVLCGTFVLDNAKLFAGFVSCPMAVRIHRNMDVESVLANMFFLGSDSGHTYSAAKAWKEYNTLPREMRPDCEADIRRMLQV
jgi:hypothetical protein